MAADPARAEPPGFARAAAVADAVLWEGYVLYPYRASALKNRMRWQFGVLAPSGPDHGHPSWAQTECLVVPGETGAALTVRARFLQICHRNKSGHEHSGPDSESPWEQGLVREVDAYAALLPGTNNCTRFAFPAAPSVHQRSHALSGALLISASPPQDDGLLRVRIRIENHTAGVHRPRAEMLLGSFVGTHALLAADGGRFLSPTDPPRYAARAAAACENRNAWPALIDDVTVLSAPIILGDYPAVAPQSRADLCDLTEIDELLLLRTMTLTDAEKREARATDPRSASIIDLAEALRPEEIGRLHGEMRRTGGPPVDPEGPDTVPVSGGLAVLGCTVRLCPRAAADAQDMFLRGRPATVRAIRQDVDGRIHLAVTLDEDPGADLRNETGRFLYFAPDEVELR